MTPLLEAVAKDIPNFQFTPDDWKATRKALLGDEPSPSDWIDQLNACLANANAVILTDDEKLWLKVCSRKGDAYPVLEMAAFLQISGLAAAPSKEGLPGAAAILKKEIARRLRALDARIREVKPLADKDVYIPRSNDDLFAEETKGPRNRWEAAKTELEQLNEDHKGMFAQLGNVFTINAAKKAVKDAANAYNAALAVANSQPQVEKREKIEAAEKCRAAHEQKEKDAQQHILATANRARRQLLEIQNAASPIFEAAIAKHWFSKPSIQAFWTMGRALIACRLPQAAAAIGQISDYRLPLVPDFYLACTTVGREFIARAREDGHGYQAILGYTGIAADSVNLSLPHLSGWTSRVVRTRLTDGDKWQALNYKIANPTALKWDPLWVVYWTLFQASQDFTKSIVRAGSEDFLTGEFVGALRHYATAWGSKVLPNFGYQNLQPNYLGAAKMGSTTPEHRIGADLAILLDIRFGEFSCKKFALFQAKNSFNGHANAASKTGQLTKLAARPDDGFYLFYHRSHRMALKPGATVRPAHELLTELTAKKLVTPGATSLRVNTTTKGWDLPSFVTFGLADPASGVGTAYRDIDDAIIKMTAQNIGLPRYVSLFSIGGTPSDQQLIKLREYGYEAAKSQDRRITQQQTQKHTPKAKGMRM